MLILLITASKLEVYGVDALFQFDPIAVEATVVTRARFF